MLKQFSIIFAILFALSVITGCMEYEPESAAAEEPMDSYRAENISQHSKIWHDEIEVYEPQERGELCALPVPEMLFYSLEEFLYAYAEVSDGRAFC
ncbi:MAG: hypothetical protein FWE27_00410 [Defluviitaleaceae bacterium]|nr:hypothetical protein [Defluviitaleaceae bacterium]